MAALVGTLCATVAFVVITLTAPRFLARMDFFIVQNTSTTDFYSLFKSSEFLSEILVDAVHTERFIERVVATSAGDVLHLPINKKERLNAWRKIVDVSQRHKLGRLGIVVYGNSRHEVNVIANGVADVLIQQNDAFRGGKKEDVDVRLLTGPVIEPNPPLKDIIIAVVASFFCGVVFVYGIGYMRHVYDAYNSNGQRPLYAPQRAVISLDNNHDNDTDSWEHSFDEIARKLQHLNNTRTDDGDMRNDSVLK